MSEGPLRLGADVVCYSLEPWDDIWRRNQFFVRELLRLDPDVRVLFVEPPTDAPHALHHGRIPRRPYLRRSSFDDRLWLLTPTRWLPKRLGDRSQAGPIRQVDSAIARLSLRAPVRWVNDSRYAAVAEQEAVSSVYDITDDWILAAPNDGERRRLANEDARLMKAATEVVVCSPGLVRSRQPIRDVHLVRNGVDTARFQASHPRPKWLGPGPTAAYVGTLHEGRIDVPLLAEVLREIPSYDFYLVGPDHLADGARRRLRSHSNVHLVGPIPHDEVPAIMQHADVYIVPHRVTPFTQSLDPIKLFECAASGTPTVATPVAGFRETRVGNVVTARDAEDFERAILDPPPRIRKPRAEGLDWVFRGAAFAHVIASATRPSGS